MPSWRFVLGLGVFLWSCGFLICGFHGREATLSNQQPPSPPVPNEGEPPSDLPWGGAQSLEADIQALLTALKADRTKQSKLERLQSKHQALVCSLLRRLEAARMRDIKLMSRLCDNLRALPRTVQELEFDNHVEVSRLCSLLADLGYPPPAEAAIYPPQQDPFGGTNALMHGDSSTMPASLFSSARPSRPESPSPRSRGHSQASTHTPLPRSPDSERAMEIPTPLRGSSQQLAAGQRSPIAPRIPTDTLGGNAVETYRELLRSEVDGWHSGYELARIQGSQRFDRDITRVLRELRMKKDDTLRELEYKFRARLRESSVELDKELLQSRQSEFRRKITVLCDLSENEITSEHQNLKLGYLNEIGDHWHDTDVQLRKASDDFQGCLGAVTEGAEQKRVELRQKLSEDHDRSIKSLVDKYIDELRYAYQSGTKKPKLGM